MKHAQPTREMKTEIRYEKEARRLLGLYATSGYPHSNQGFIQWLEHKNQHITVATWRSYRAALNFHFTKEQERHCLDTIEHASYSAILAGIAQLNHPNQKQPPRCSTKKQKTISKADLALILDELDRSGSDYARFAQLLLVNGIVFGLRPHEWQHASLVTSQSDTAPSKLGLRTKNGKQSNGRANGRYRTIWFGEAFNPEQLSLVRELLVYIHQQNLSQPSQWEKAYSAARQLLLRANKRCFPTRKRTISLYSARHQFSADLKNTQDLFEIAAMMGQRSSLTPAAHYGKRQYGTARPEDLRVYPDQANLAVVTAHAEQNAKVLQKLRHPAMQPRDTHEGSK